MSIWRVKKAILTHILSGYDLYYIRPHVLRKQAVTRPKKDPRDIGDHESQSINFSRSTSPMRFQQTAFFTLVSRREECLFFFLGSTVYRNSVSSSHLGICSMPIQTTVEVELADFNHIKLY